MEQFHSTQEVLQKSMADNLATYIATSTPDQVEYLLTAIRELTSNRTPNAENRDDKAAKSCKITKKAASRAVKAAVSKFKAKRPLNSWMAFRGTSFLLCM